MHAMTVITFSYSCPEEVLAELAQDFATNVRPTVRGLIWKIFLHQAEKQRAGGIYLFENIQAAQEYVESPYVQGLRAAPILSDVSVEVYETIREVSLQTGAPL